MKVLITGGTGFIGLHTARAFLDAGHEVVSTQFRVRRDPSFVANERGNRLQREVVDMTSPYAFNDVLRRHGVDTIVHLAVPAYAALSPSEDYRTNMSSLLNVLDGAVTYGVRRVLIASSITVYDQAGPGPFAETAGLPMRSATATGAYKKAWEILATHYADRANLELICARIGYIYGPLYHSMYNVLARMVHSALRGQALVKPDEGFEDDAFDYCYVKDCARALRALVTTPALPERIYNVGAGRATSLGEIRAAVRALVPDYDVALTPGRSPANEGPRSYMTLDALARDAGYAPAYDIGAGIRDYAEWLGDNEF